jgi:predicted homoserine dehydrogenase-like protein
MMTRRQFLRKSSTAALALSAAAAATHVPATFAAEKIRRVGLIGAGWYGKSDLWRLVQVEPVEIVSICDPDKHMLEEAVTIASERQKSRKRPRTYGDYRQMLK